MMSAVGRVASAVEQRYRLLTFAHALAPMLVSLVLQFFAFVVTARELGATQFGLYTALLALALIGSDLVGLGAIELLTRGTARDKSSFRRYFGHLLLMTSLTLPVVAAVCAWLAWRYLALPVPAWLLCLAVLAELVNGRAMTNAEGIMVAHGHATHASWVRLSCAVARVCTVVVYFHLLGRDDLQGWLVAVCLLGGLTAVACYWVCAARFGSPQRWFARGELRAGLVLSLTQIATTFQSNIDRLILSRHAAAAQVGAYSAAMRVFQVGSFPLNVATRVTYPQFFVAHNVGGGREWRFAVRVTGAMLLVGLAATGVVCAASWLMPSLLGAGFAGTQQIMILLSLALPAMACQTPAGDALTAADRHQARAACYWVAALAFVPMGILGASLDGATGIAIAYVASHVLLAALLWGCLYRHVFVPARRGGPTEPAPAAEAER